MIDFEGFSLKATDYDSVLPAAAKVSTHYVDGLRYRFYRGVFQPENIVIVYHGGGVSMDAGYGILARQLVTLSHLSVCLVDMRGHGESTGEKGHLSHPTRLWQDVDRLITELKQHYPDAKYQLLGHSSGAGMLINYFTRYKPAHQINHLILLAPELGPFARGIPRKKSDTSFAQVRQWPFILNAFSQGKLCGNYPAVQLNFPKNICNVAGQMVDCYSVNMANALTPRSPDKQLNALPLPTLLLAAEFDELFDSQAMAAFARKFGNSQLDFRLLSDCYHLDCLFHSYNLIGEFIKDAQ